ncbi:transcriptional attenuator, LytR family [Nostoc sp. PCC 7524]|uniref:LCP family protein n=1 Tax=Nostoc sp. (strain ATCC 29411 / PCC 7524) TaxID=28072 RepID=UPI00029F0177|nr:LCP family protein [Nostoc sp. PCC 7524]AFY46778.1 transcriptional attenuator, LytR family [Nostoc sp. PCC 7524]
MIKQVQFSDNQVTPQQIPDLELGLQPSQLQRLDHQVIAQPATTGEIEVRPQQQSAIASRNVVESVGAIPNELYERLGLAMPRWLLWILTVVLGIILSGLLASTLALWTPLWSNLDRTDEELGFSGQDEQKMPLPGELWSKISQYQLSKPMNILIMGIEPVKGAVDGSAESFSGNSDTMMLVRLNPASKTMRVLSIPRDTMIAIPEQGLTKVSEANAQGGPVLAARVVSRTLNNARIDRYIRISTSGLRQVVDQLGGVEVFVPKAMSYQDPNTRSTVSLVSGWQTLNGEQAELFVRYREEGLGDLTRVQRQQAVVAALLQRLNSPTVLPRLPQLTRLMRKYFDSNLKIEEMMALVNFSVNLERDNFQMTMLPGTFSKFSKDPNSYWLNLTGQQNLLNNYVGVDIPGLKSDSRPVSKFRIAIQNASNQPQLTEKVIAYLKQKGFTNIYTTPEWPDTQRQTQIIVQRGNRAAAIELQNILGLGLVQVKSTGDLESDITIRIGKDWK